MRPLSDALPKNSATPGGPAEARTACGGQKTVTDQDRLAGFSPVRGLHSIGAGQQCSTVHRPAVNFLQLVRSWTSPGEATRFDFRNPYGRSFCKGDPRSIFGKRTEPRRVDQLVSDRFCRGWRAKCANQCDRRVGCGTVKGCRSTKLLGSPCARPSGSGVFRICLLR